MKRLFITLLAVSATLFASAQDVIFLGANDSIVGKVISIGTSEITYKKWTNLEGPIYSLSINQIAAIRYANGTYDFLNNKTSPVVTNTNNAVSVIRSGNSYMYGDLVMNKGEFEDWLKEQNCSAACMQFTSGRKTANAGWALMATGLMADLVGTIIVVKAKNVSGPGAVLMGIGGALEIACIPTIAVGYSKMHRSVDVYNASCKSTASVQPYWAVQASSNGIGLAYHF